MKQFPSKLLKNKLSTKTSMPSKSFKTLGEILFQPNKNAINHLVDLGT